MADFDAGTYGRSFADVYDDWYPTDETTTACVDALDRLAGTRAAVLELGVGTGRLAVALSELGHAVTGIDASARMVDRLHAKDAHGRIRTVVADVGDPAAWPDGPFDLVVAACNLVCNLTDPREQAACIAGAAARLRPGGHLVVEAFEPAPLVAGPQIAASEVRSDAVVLIATDTDPATAVVVGNHVELRDGQPVRLRPWRIRVTTPAEIDAWADAAGLTLVHRSRTWTAAAAAADGVAHPDPDPHEPDAGAADGLVSIYRA